MDKSGIVFYVKVDLIVPNPYQPRVVFGQDELQSLADSIREHGIMQPLLAKEVLAANGSVEQWVLIAGERRLQAAKLAGLDAVPVVVRECSEEEMLEMALIENVQRQDLTAIEEARAYFSLVEKHHLSVDVIAQRMGKSRATISNKLRLLHLPQDVQNKMMGRKISERQGMALLAMYELPEELLKRAEASHDPRYMHSKIIQDMMDGNGVSSDRIREFVHDVCMNFTRRIIWGEKVVFAVPADRPALCGDCPMLIRSGGDRLCVDESCFHVRLNAYNRQSFPVPQPAPAPSPAPAQAPTPVPSKPAPASQSVVSKPARDEEAIEEDNAVDEAIDDEAPNEEDETLTGVKAPAVSEPLANTAAAALPAAVNIPVSAAEVWKKSTITISITMMAEDGDASGRPCMIGLRANNNVPMMITCREKNIQLTGFMADLLEDLKTKEDWNHG